jgi:hypothetical protein
MDRVKNIVTRHPNLTAWLVLGLGMVIILLIEARDVGLEPLQWFWLVVITILVAGACVWIISWGDDDEETDEPVKEQAAEQPDSAEPTN